MTEKKKCRNRPQIISVRFCHDKIHDKKFHLYAKYHTIMLYNFQHKKSRKPLNFQRKPWICGISLCKQITGVEPAFPAWEASVLPMNHICGLSYSTPFRVVCQTPFQNPISKEENRYQNDIRSSFFFKFIGKVLFISSLPPAVPYGFLWCGFPYRSDQ